jgi:predicted signal transduction protein with EAL and GGDEF domain
VVVPAAWNTTGAKSLDGMSCACALWLTGSSIDSKPKAAMTMFELVTNCLVCICFFLFEVWFLLVFPASVVYAGSFGKAERPPETRHDCAVFL